MVHEIENFFGVYLLYNINPKYKGRTYIGFTVDPNRRVNQHNKGSNFGGAKKTSGKGPWDMVMIIHGFPNRISALRFEWAWQNPKKSRRLRHIAAKRKQEKTYEYCFRLVCEMLRTTPWSRLPLTFRWLKQEYRLEFEPHLQPPIHMPLQFGPVKPKQVTAPPPSQSQPPTQDEDLPQLSQLSRKLCAVCHDRIQPDSNTLQCLAKSCTMISHTLCLARSFLRCEGVLSTQLVPISGSCPQCQQEVLWGDLIRFKLGCYQGREDSQHGDSNHWADDLQV